MQPSLLDDLFTLQPASELEPQAVDWLWPGRLARGKLAILDGDPGMGKSLLSLDLCARLSTGRPLPEHSSGAQPCTSIVINGEDGAGDMIRPQLAAMGADLDRVFILGPSADNDHESIRIPTHVATLQQSLERSNASLVIIDPIMAFLDAAIAVASDASVRRALAPLAHLARSHGCAIVLVRHLTKLLTFRSLYRGGGSIGIVGVCRSGWLAAQDPQDPDKRVLAQVKNNLAELQPSLAYKIESLPDGRLTIRWLGPSMWSGDQLLAAANKECNQPTQIERACEFLKAALSDGSKTSRELWPLARKLRLSHRSLVRAKARLSIRSLRVWADGQRLSYWLLPGQKLPESVPPESAAPDLEEYLAPLREMYPPGTPIDDI